jgi:hypothetical protein
MIQDVPECKNGCIVNQILNYGWNTIQVKTENNVRIFYVFTCLYFTKDSYGISHVSFDEKSKISHSKKYYKEFLNFEEARDDFYKHDPIILKSQEEEFLRIPLK